MEYIAVDPASRSKGIGMKLFEHCAEQIGSKTRLLVEVDAADSTAPNATDIEARLRFYRRCGCAAIADLAYLLPLSTAAGPPPAMQLFVLAPVETEIALAELVAFLRALYAEVYDKPPDDPRIDAMVRDLPDPVRLVPCPQSCDATLGAGLRPAALLPQRWP